MLEQHLYLENVHRELRRLELKKGSVLCLPFADPLEPGAVALRWSSSPKILRSLGH